MTRQEREREKVCSENVSAMKQMFDVQKLSKRKYFQTEPSKIKWKRENDNNNNKHSALTLLFGTSIFGFIFIFSLPLSFLSSFSLVFFFILFSFFFDCIIQQLFASQNWANVAFLLLFSTMFFSTLKSGTDYKKKLILLIAVERIEKEKAYTLEQEKREMSCGEIGNIHEDTFRYCRVIFHARYFSHEIFCCTRKKTIVFHRRIFRLLHVAHELKKIKQMGVFCLVFSFNFLSLHCICPLQS